VAAVTGAVTLALYEWVIRPTAAGRALFGVPDRAARTRRAAPAASPVRLPAGAVTPASAAAELATAGARRAGALALR
jgi:hypothetical protein